MKKTIAWFLTVLALGAPAFAATAAKKPAVKTAVVVAKPVTVKLPVKVASTATAGTIKLSTLDSKLVKPEWLLKIKAASKAHVAEYAKRKK